MSWSQPFLDLVQSRAANAREAYAAASTEITGIVKMLDEFSDGQEDDTKGRRKLERSLRDIRWSAFEGLQVTQSAPLRSPLRSLRACVQSCTRRIEEALSTPEGLVPFLSAQVTEELLGLRQSLAGQEFDLLLKLERWTFALRGAVALVVCGAAMATTFFLFFSGLTVEHFQPVAPSADYHQRGNVYQMSDQARHAITARYSEFVTKQLPGVSSFASLLTGGTDEATKETPKPGPPDPFANARPVRSLFQSVCETELLNRSYLHSEYVGVLTCRLAFLKETQFPWDEVFSKREPVPIRFHPPEDSSSRGAFLGAIANEGSAPVLVTLTAKAGDLLIASYKEIVLGTSFPMTLIHDQTVWSDGNEFSNVPQPPPTVRLEAGTAFDIELTFETVDGTRLDQKFTAKLPRSISQRKFPSFAAPAPGGVELLAALTGKATTVGEHSIRVDVPIDIEGITEGEARTTVIPVDRYLAARGHMAVYARFTPKMSGHYMRYRLRTLVIVLALGPPVLAAFWLWVLPLTPTSFGDAVLIGFREGMAVLLLCALLQSGLAAFISLQNHSTINR